MYSDEQGFILIDALICTMIMSSLVLILTGIIQSHANVQDRITDEKEKMEAQWESHCRTLTECIVCETEEDSS